MKYCSKCVMPETAESLTFDESGVCSVCNQIEVKQTEINWLEKTNELNEIISKVKGKHDYDCIVPFSGGKDSVYTLWYIVKKLNLRPLVVRFDHGFMRNQLEKNVKNTFKILGVDSITFTPNWQVVKKLMFESLRRRGDFCWHCHTGIFSYPMWVAIKEKVPLVLWGEPSAEYSSFYSYDDDEEVDERRFNSFINLGINAEDMVGMLDNTISDYPVSMRDLKPFQYPPSREIRQNKIRSVCLGSFIPWDVKKLVEIIKKELLWKGDEVEGVPPEYDYEKIECFMQGVRDYIKFLKRGFGRTTHLTSIDIRNNRLSRDDAISLVQEYDGKRPFALDIFLEYLDISEEKFMELILPHEVSPNKMPTLEKCKSCECISNKKPHDYDSWFREVNEN